MPAIPLGLSAYQRADLPPVTLKNFFYEKAPTNLEDQVVLMPRPRLKQYAAPGAGPMRGLYRKTGSILGRLLALSGDKLYRVDPTDEASPVTLIGDVNGSGNLTAEGDATVAVLAAGASAYSTDGVTLATITVPDGQNIIAVDILNSYFLFGVEGSGRFYWSALGGITIDALDYATAESQPDALTTLKVIGDELWLIGLVSTEVWQPTGDQDLPFQRIQGRTFGIGCRYAKTVQKLLVNGLDSLCWVGAEGRVYRTAPNPERISDHGMEERIARATGPLSSGRASWMGHDFYILHIPGEGSFAYDMSTGFWDEWTSYGRALFRGAVSGIGPAGQPLFGDDEEGVIWELVDSERTDDGAPVLFEFTGLLENSSEPQRCHNVVMDISTGLTPDPESDPLITLSYSGDNGQTYSPEVPTPLGRQGKRLTKVMWKKVGTIKRPGRVFRWRTIEPVTVRRAKFNESYH